MKPCSLIASSLLVLAASTLPGCKKKDAPPAAGEVPTTPAAVVDAPAPPPPAPIDAAAPDAAKAAAGDPLKDICPQVISKIQECAEDKEFAAALRAGASARVQKTTARLIAEITDWPMNPCDNLAANYEYSGFLDHWDQLADPAILESCGKLGAAVQAAGGLFGGDSDL